GTYTTAFGQLYMVYRFILVKSIMKRSEKVKGKERVAQKKRQYRTIGLAVAGVIIVVAILLFMFFNPFLARAGDTVTVYYTGTLDNGTVFDSNMNGTPLTFLLGSGQLIPGFEEAVAGLSANEQKTVWIPVEKAYGPHQLALVHEMSRSIFPANETPVPGDYYNFRRTTTGATSRIKVINVTPDTVTVDENHVLTGQNLTFTIRLVSFVKGAG
ncbi:MAG: FKBP-type peptidyl-prolyl cis-trans isomerase, partial [Methanoregula sp.]|nr:FKBP-type peptidyl-prolyl cis-trans isomerase [Methanoregula sp.]